MCHERENFQGNGDDWIDGDECGRFWPESHKPGNPQEPAGFVTGAVIGAFAGGPIGAVVGAGLGTWLGNRVHRASEAKKAEAQLALLQTNNAALATEKAALLDEKTQLLQSNQMLNAQLSDVTKQVDTVQSAQADASQVLGRAGGRCFVSDRQRGDLPELAHQVQVLAQAGRQDAVA